VGGGGPGRASPETGSGLSAFANVGRPVDLRDLEQIQEEHPRSRPLPFGALLLAAICGGALVVVAMGAFQKEAPPATQPKDPLAELLAQQNPGAPVGRVDDRDVTFPDILSDGNKPTTALAAVKDERGRLVEAAPSGSAAGGSPQIDLPSNQQPAGDLLRSTSVTTEPKDDLSQLAASRLSGAPSALAPLGSQGGYEIQVASFPDAPTADAFVEELRKRGHSAYRQAAYVPEKGLWHRVRIGSFKHKHEALAYQKKLEQGERLSTFLVDPEKVKRQESIRAAKQEARDRKLERLRNQAEPE
jgi:DedD protein